MVTVKLKMVVETDRKLKSVEENLLYLIQRTMEKENWVVEVEIKKEMR